MRVINIYDNNLHRQKREFKENERKEAMYFITFFGLLLAAYFLVGTAF